MRGEVVGVNSAIYTRTGSNMGIGFAIPVNLVKEELPQLRDSGKVVRGWLGVYIQKMTPEIAESLGLAEPRGALVAEVLDDGPAKAAGVKRGDVIVAFDGIADRRLARVAADGRAHAARPRATLKVIRDKQDARAAGYDYGLARGAISRLPTKQPDRGHRRRSASPSRTSSPDLAHELGLGQSKRRGDFVGAARQPADAGRPARARRHPGGQSRTASKQRRCLSARAEAGASGKIVLLLVKRGDSTIFVPLEPEG